MLGMVRRVFFFKSKLSLLLFYLAQGKCLGSSIFSSYGKYYFPFFFFFFILEQRPLLFLAEWKNAYKEKSAFIDYL